MSKRHAFLENLGLQYVSAYDVSELINQHFSLKCQKETNKIPTISCNGGVLNDLVSNLVPATAYRDHIIQQNFEVTLEITGLQLSTITLDYFDFGTLEDSRLILERVVEIPF